MRIAWFVATVHKADGVSRVLSELAARARADGHEILVVTAAVDGSASTLPHLQVPSVVFPVYRDYKIPFPGVRRFARALDDFAPDIVHLHSPDPIAWSALRYARARRIPVIATHHTDFARRLGFYGLGSFASLGWRTLRRLYERMDAVTSPSLAATTDLTHLGLANVATIPWGVDGAVFHPGFRSEAWRASVAPGKSRIVLFVSRLAWEKELRLLVEIQRRLARQRSDVALVVAGDGPNRGALVRLAPKAVLLGHLDGAALSRAYASADVLLFPSSSETFGNVTLEAMASGLVPVVADAGGSQSLVRQSGAGLVSRPGDAASFAANVVRVLDDEALRTRLRRAGLAFARTCSWEATQERMVDLYVATVGGTPRLPSARVSVAG